MSNSANIAIPDFQIRAKIGQGGMGAVYLAQQISTQQLVALKIISRTAQDDRDSVRRLLRESAIVAKLEHPSIVPTLQAGSLHEHHFVAMEHLAGGSLRERLQSGERGETLARRVITAIASALDAAHRMGFLHRDVKPSNILFRDDGTPVLTDFGLAREIRVLRKLTATGLAVGTPRYMSPEQLAGAKLDGRSDLYSLGIVFYEVLTGNVPFAAETFQTLSLMHRTQTMPMLPACHAAYQPFINRLTAKDRDHRFQTGAEVIAALVHIVAAPDAEVAAGVRADVVDAVSRDGSLEQPHPRRGKLDDTTVIRTTALDAPRQPGWRVWLSIAVVTAVIAGVAYVLLH